MNRVEYDQIAAYLQRAAASKYSAGDIKARFEAEPASAYGQNMAQWIPDFAYAHQLLLDCLALHLPAAATAVELGAGSGRVAQLLLDAFPDLQLTLVDLSANMLRAAEQRLAAASPHCRFVVHDIFDPALEFPPGSLDGVVSVFAICHAQGAAVYEQLYQRIERWLKPGGCFVCYDHVLGDTPEWTALNALGWRRLLAASQSAEQVEDAIVGTYQEDSPLSLRHHLALLSAAGFGAVDVLYKRDIFALYAALKQPAI